MPTWPATLPQEFEAPGFQDRLPDQVERSRVRGELPQYRRRARRSEFGPVAGEMLMTSDQWQALRTFYWQTLASGALSFDFPDPDGGSEPIVVHFEQPPRLSTIGGDLHSVSLTFNKLR